MSVPGTPLEELSNSGANQGVIYNENERRQRASRGEIISRTTAAEPGSPSDGDRYLLPSSGLSGTNWPGNEDEIAVYIGGAWEFHTPVEGWRVWVADENLLIAYDGSAWDIIGGLLYAPTVSAGSGTFTVTTASHRGRVIVADTQTGSPVGDTTIALPAAATAGDGFTLAVVKVSSSDTVTIDGNGAETINGSATLDLTDQYDSRILVCDGSEWYTLGGGGGGGSGAPFSDGSALVKNASDATKLLKLSAASISTGTTRTVTFPDEDGTIVYDFDDLPDVPASKSGNSLLFLRVNAGETALEYATPAGGGDVSGPGGSPATTDNAIVRWNGTTGTVIQNSGVVIDDDDHLSGHGTEINEQTGTTYTIQGSDNGKTITFTNASAVTVTVPQTSTEAITAGFQCALIQRGAGQVTVAFEGNDGVESKDGNLSLTGQHSAATIIKLEEDVGSPTGNLWGLYGDLA